MARGGGRPPPTRSRLPRVPVGTADPVPAPDGAPAEQEQPPPPPPPPSALAKHELHAARLQFVAGMSDEELLMADGRKRKDKQWLDVGTAIVAKWASQDNKLGDKLWDDANGAGSNWAKHRTADIGTLEARVQAAKT